MSRVLRPKPDLIRVGDALPAACDVHDLVRVFGVSLRTIYDWRDAGKLRRFELRRPLGARKWSGKLLQAHLDGEGAGVSAWAQRRAS